jgi:hypothetical protein
MFSARAHALLRASSCLLNTSETTVRTRLRAGLRRSPCWLKSRVWREAFILRISSRRRATPLEARVGLRCTEPEPSRSRILGELDLLDKRSSASWRMRRTQRWRIRLRTRQLSRASRSQPALASATFAAGEYLASSVARAGARRADATLSIGPRSLTRRDRQGPRVQLDAFDSTPSERPWLASLDPRPAPIPQPYPSPRRGTVDS